MSEMLVARIVWWLAGLAFVGGGIGWVWWPASVQIASVRENAREMYDEANANDAQVRRAASVREARARITADLGALAGQVSNGAATAVALQLLSDESKRFGVELRSVAPQDVPGPMPSPTTTLGGEALIPSDMTLGLRGNFRSVATLIADLPRHQALIAVRAVSLQATDAFHSGVPTLDVTVRATLYRIANATMMEGIHAARTPR